MLQYDYPNTALFKVCFKSGIQILNISGLVDLYDSKFIDSIPLIAWGFPHLHIGESMQTFDPLINPHLPNSLIIRIS